MPLPLPSAACQPLKDYTNAEGKEVNDIIYNKAALDKAVEKIMKDQGALNFKYIQEVTTKEAK